MRRAALASGVVYSLLLSFATFAQTSKSVETIPVSQIHAGMHGVAYTVFEGTKPEAMQVEVLGVLKNANGPKGDVILVRLGGKKAEYTGVVAGMSGSPVYFDGKLAGALAFRIGEFSKERLEPGSAVSAILVRGDMDIAATCTVTYMDAAHLLACGHPLMQFGSVNLPMTKAQVVATLASPLNAFKIVNATEPVGAFVQDRHTGIMGEFGKKPDMIPVTLNIRGGPSTKKFHYEVLNNAHLSPLAMMATVFNALHGMNEYGEEITYRMNGRISVGGYPDVGVENMFAAADGGQPAAVLAALSLGDRFSRIYDNPYSVPDIRGVQLDFDLVRDRRAARLESARTDVTEARPGDDITIEAVLRPYRGDGMVNQIAIHIPTSSAKGPLRLLGSGGDPPGRHPPWCPPVGPKPHLPSTIAWLNKQHVNNRVYVSLLEGDPEAMVGDKVMPTLPLSVMNVMDGMRGTQEMVVLGESSVNETSSQALDYAVSGAQVLTITVK